MKPSHLRTPRESRNTEFGQYHDDKPLYDKSDKIVLWGCIVVAVLVAGILAWGR